MSWGMFRATHRPAHERPGWRSAPSGSVPCSGREPYGCHGGNAPLERVETPGTHLGALDAGLGSVLQEYHPLDSTQIRAGDSRVQSNPRGPRNCWKTPHGVGAPVWTGVPLNPAPHSTLKHNTFLNVKGVLLCLIMYQAVKAYITSALHVDKWSAPRTGKPINALEKRIRCFYRKLNTYCPVFRILALLL